MYKSNKIIIPESFKSKDGKLIIKLKSKIIAHSEIDEDGKFVIGAIPIFEIKINSIKREDVVDELKEKIINSYKKYVLERKQLSQEELVLFYYIKDIKFSSDIKRNTNNNTLIFAYDDDIFNIKNTILKFDTNCDHFNIYKNIELYNIDEYEKMYKKFVNKCNKNKYNKFILDISNLYLDKDYNNTKKIIEYIESTNGKILFLIPRLSSTEERFIKIFGEKYKDCIIDKEKYLHPNQTLALYKIKTILFD